MARVSNRIYRVAGDEGPPITVEWAARDVSSDTITLQLEHDTGQKFTLAAVIDDGPNGVFHFDLLPIHLVQGCHCFGILFDPGSSDTFTLPSKNPLQLVVRRNNRNG